MPFFKDKHTFILIIFIIIILGYGLKSLIGINIFSSFSFHSFFPFKYLKNDIVKVPKPCIILSENFNKRKLFKNFKILWIKGKGTVKKDWSPDGFSGSRCLIIKSIGNKSWGYLFKKKVEVQIGDQFNMEGLINLSGDTISAYLNVAALDKNEEVIDWNLCRSGDNRTGEWTKIEKQFNITDKNIRYIRFSLIGTGNGEFRFDNIIFQKLNFSD